MQIQKCNNFLKNLAVYNISNTASGKEITKEGIVNLNEKELEENKRAKQENLLSQETLSKEPNKKH